MDVAMQVSNEEKKAVWEAYRRGTPTRVPTMLATNPRIILLDPRRNAGGYSFKRYFADPQVMIAVQLQHARYRAETLHHFTDDPVGLPDVWRLYVDRQNIYEAAFLGAPLVYREGQVPDTQPILSDARKERIFDLDIGDPLDLPYLRESLEFCLRMKDLVRNLEVDGRPVEVANYAPTGTDGPLTVAMNLRGQAMMEDLLADPDYATRLMAFITDAAIERVRALRRYWGDESLAAGLADDSIQLISTALYREMVLPHHRRFLDTFLPDRPRSIHLCGDSTRHFRLLRDELNIRSFDTGFPVAFGPLRRELGPDVEILGGPPVSLLLQGTPQQVYARATEILQSGVKEGGRFVLREGNNLPPCVPEGNLAAMYRAALDHGGF
jgi:hypothetical protein